jgi:hypothetical protein
VPLGVSRFNREARMRPHTRDEAAAVVDAVHDWQEVFRAALGRRLVFCGDEYYLLADRPFPEAATYGDFSMHEDGIGMARAFEVELFGGPSVDVSSPVPARPSVEPAGPPCGGGPAGPAGPGPADPGSTGPMAVSHDRGGFFRWSDGDLSTSVDADYEPYRTVRAAEPAPTPGAGAHDGHPVVLRPRKDAPVAILTGPYGARVLAPLVERLGRPDVRVVAVENRYFGGNIGVSGLMVGEDLTRALLDQPAGHRYLLPDVCLSQGRFLDGTSPEDLPHPVEVVPASGAGLRTALGLDGPARPPHLPSLDVT